MFSTIIYRIRIKDLLFNYFRYSRLLENFCAEQDEEKPMQESTRHVSTLFTLLEETPTNRITVQP